MEASQYAPLPPCGDMSSASSSELDASSSTAAAVNHGVCVRFCSSPITCCAVAASVRGTVVIMRAHCMLTEYAEFEFVYGDGKPRTGANPRLGFRSVLLLALLLVGAGVRLCVGN